MPAIPSTKQPVVFISYAHESDAFRDSVKNLADRIEGFGCTVLTDHPYRDRPPEEGWQAWMLGCINRSDIVLVICSPKLKARYEKTELPGVGFGGTYEGAIVTQIIYDEQMRNGKFYPVLPDAGSFDDVPTTLRPWSNGHRFPSGLEGIRRMIFAEPVTGIQPPDSESGAVASGVFPKYLDSHHQRLASRLLAADEAGAFWAALQVEFAGAFPGGAAPQAVHEMVRQFSECPPEQVLQLFLVVRSALLDVPPKEKDPRARKQAEKAAAAMYCLAACRLVNLEVRAARDYTFQVPRLQLDESGKPTFPGGEQIICAIIATALFGGELHLAPAEGSDLPRPEYVFEFQVPAAGDQIVESFERAAYVAVFENDRNFSIESLGSGPLDKDRRALLAARLRTIKKVQKRSLALVVRGLTDHMAVQAFANAHQVPVMFPVSEVTNALIGMDASVLLAEISEFWNELDASADVTPPPNKATKAD